MSSSVERLEFENLRAGGKRRDDRKKRIRRRGADEGDVPTLHIGQKRVLLDARKAMDLVDEEDGSLAAPAPFQGGFLGHFPDIGNACRNCIERHEMSAASLSDQMRERGFA